LGGVWIAWLGGRVQTMGDYPHEFAPSMNALLAGHLDAFRHLMPEDGAGGSVLLRAPAALVGSLLVGGQQAIFRFGTLGCELAAGGLGLALASDMRRRGLPLLSRAVTVGLCVLAAGVLDAVFFGHPEETLGASLCIGAVLLSGASRPTLAGVMLGFAIIDKPWGVLAIAPVVLASPAGVLSDPLRLSRLGLGAGAVLVAWLALAFALDPVRLLHAMSTASGLVIEAHPVDVWWSLAHAVHKVGVTPYYAPPRFLSQHAREIAVLLMIPLSLPLAFRRLPAALPRIAAGPRAGIALQPAMSDRAATDAALALLALLLLLRCMLDPSDHVYYHVPFVLALLAWESRVSRLPLRALSATGLLWLIFHTLSGVADLSMQQAAYLLVTVPLAILLFGAARGRGLRSPLAGPRSTRRQLRAAGGAVDFGMPRSS
jgi:hypothetical protein